MPVRALAGTGLGRLRLLMALFFLALAIPTGVLVFHAYGQLKWEAFHQYRQLAEELSRRIDRRVSQLIATEEARGFTDYQFLVVEGEGRANFLQRSPLSAYPVTSAIPGLIGWFQVDTDGSFSSPLLPRAALPIAGYRLDEGSRAERATLESRIQSILSANRLVGGRPVPPAATGVALQEKDVVAAAVDAGASAPGFERAPREADRDGAGSTSRDITRSIPGDRKSSATAGSAVLQGLESISKLAAPGSKPDSAAPEPVRRSAQAAFDELSSAVNQAARRKQAPPGKLGRVDDLELSSPYAAREEEQRRVETEERKRQSVAQRARRPEAKKRAVRKEVEIAAVTPRATDKNEDANVRAQQRGAAVAGTFTDAVAPRIQTFESELDPFELSLLDSGHFVLYRKVWRDGQRYIQGALIEQKPFLSGLVETAFQGTALSRMSNLVVAWQGDVFAAFSGDLYRALFASTEELSGALLYRTRMSAPLADLELVFSVTRMPAGAGASVIVWTALVLALVLIVGVWLMYRLGARQLALAHQQRDFVSAVSHELRTPITSIRMYAEMLREGWASEEKKRSYYEFIVQESERLSRLITNVLQLARMTRNDFAVQLECMSVAELMDGVRSTLTSQVQHAGFELNLGCSDAAAAATLHVDADAFSQCVINLVDNALKFSAASAIKVVEVDCRLDSDAHLNVSVRDHGPGVARDQMKKIFTLFYRSENELTRETVGTGIGLALVHQLMRAMNGTVDVANAGPGAVFTLRLPTIPHAPGAGSL